MISELTIRDFIGRLRIVAYNILLFINNDAKAGKSRVSLARELGMLADLLLRLEHVEKNLGSENAATVDSVGLSEKEIMLVQEFLMHEDAVKPNPGTSH